MEAVLGLVLGGRCDRRVRGARLHLAHPLGIAGYANRRVKNDIADATLLADLLRMGRLPEAWVAPPAVRELREEVRYRHKLYSAAVRVEGAGASGARQGGGDPGDEGDLVVRWAALARRTAARRRVHEPDRVTARSDRALRPRDRAVRHPHPRRLKGDPGYEAIQQIAGVGRSWPPCSSPRSVTSTGSPTPVACVRGPG